MLLVSVVQQGNLDLYTHTHTQIDIDIDIDRYIYIGFSSGPVVKNLPAMQESQDR